jgi:hypothetical protein
MPSKSVPRGILGLIVKNAPKAGSAYLNGVRSRPIATAAGSAAAGGVVLGAGMLMTSAGATLATFGAVGAVVSGLATGLCVYGGFTDVARVWGKAMGGCLMLSFAGAGVGMVGSAAIMGGQAMLAGSAALGAYGVGRAAMAHRRRRALGEEPDAVIEPPPGTSGQQQAKACRSFRLLDADYTVVS